MIHHLIKPYGESEEGDSPVKKDATTNCEVHSLSRAVWLSKDLQLDWLLDLPLPAGRL